MIPDVIALALSFEPPAPRRGRPRGTARPPGTALRPVAAQERQPDPGAWCYRCSFGHRFAEPCIR